MPLFVGGSKEFKNGKTIRIKSSVRIDKNISLDYDRMADESNETKTGLINEALSYYRDMYYCKNKATFLNENIVHIIEAMNEEMEDRINNKSNQLLSEIAIQLCIVQQILADNLEVDGEQAATFQEKSG